MKIAALKKDFKAIELEGFQVSAKINNQILVNWIKSLENRLIIDQLAKDASELETLFSALKKSFKACKCFRCYLYRI